MNDTTIFYSWQSDHRVTKNFIDKALSGAISDLSGNNALDKAPRLDKDTQGTIGSPNIVSTIKDKIDNCGIFVADVSIVDESKSGRKLVNQNVMFELGYAIAKHSEVNAVMLFNSDLGDPKDLPFDISHHRVQQFSIKDDNNGSKLKEKLIGALTAHLNSLAEQEVAQIEQSLDNIQLLIMRVFASMTNDRSMHVTSTMGGPILHHGGTVNNDLYSELTEMDVQEVIANLNDLATSNILNIDYVGQRNTPVYRPTKQGFEIIKILNGRSNES